MSARLVSPTVVGRTVETAWLRDAFAAAKRGEPCTVLISGEAGIGKSRLVASFLEEIGDAANVLIGGCVDLGSSELPFAPFTAALRRLVTERGAEDVTAMLPAGGASALGALLPGLGTGELPTSTDEARARMFEYLLLLLRALAERTPGVLVIEDAHWADRSSRDLLDFLVRSQQTAPGLLIVLTHRSDELERTHPLRRQLAELTRLSWVRHTQLGRLTKDDVVSQAREILGSEPDPEAIASVYHRSEGNPLFVEELLGCHAAGEDCRVPPTLEDVLLDRVVRLPAAALQCVRIASVGGAHVQHAVLSAASAPDLSPTELDAALRAAVDAGVLVAGRDEYSFRHALIRDAVYQHLLPGERGRLHARYADALTTGPNGCAEGRPAAELVHHLFAAGDTRRGMPAAWRAALAARRTLAYAEELALLNRILELWERIPDAAALLGVERHTVMEAAVESALRAGAHVCGVELASAALTALDETIEPVRVALLLERRGVMRASLGQSAALDDHSAAVRTIPGDHPARPFLLNSLAQYQMLVPLPAMARDSATEALHTARRTGDAAAEASAIITLAVLDARTGDLDAQLPQFATARAIAENVGATLVALRAWHSESHLLHAFGRLEQAIELAKNGLSAACDAGLGRSVGSRHVVDLASVLVSAGRWEEAQETIQFGLGLAPPPSYQAHLLCLRGFIALQRGELRTADATVTRAEELMADSPAFTQDPLMLARLAAELRWEQGRTGEAIDVINGSLDREHLQAATRFLWPLLAIAAKVATAATADDTLRHRGRSLHSTVSTWAHQIKAAGPVQAAWRVTVLARTHHSADAADAVVNWAEAVTAWEPLGHPLPLADALTALVEASLADGERGGDTERALRRACALAVDLGATPLRTTITSLARRARISLDGAQRQTRGPSSYGLTPRELEILRLVADGRSNADIGAELFIAPKTASVHVSNILAKLGVANRVEAAAAAHRLGLLEQAVSAAAGQAP